MLGKRIKAARMKAKQSQSELAALCGWDQGRQSHYEIERYEPSVAQLKLIARHTGSSLGYLIDDDSLGHRFTEKAIKMMDAFEMLSDSQKDDLIVSMMAMIASQQQS